MAEASFLAPFRMQPAYRSGNATPWGGEQLRAYYGREIPDERTGEALEVSAIPGLESRNDRGETLTELIDRYGERLTGLPRGTEFPLLLKLLAAKSSLSVQVHPDDAYARLHENKLGKTEAWVILHAEEGASLLYGVKEGTTLDELRRTLLDGEDVEPLIRRVPVRAGDVFYMPAGMVHAIGGGILLYEIQQSSDVTYRLWDFNRVDARGEKRPLHIRQSLDVIRPELKGLQARTPEAGGEGVERLLDVPAFWLDCASARGVLPLPKAEAFRILTAVEPLRLRWAEGEIALEAGATALLPATCPPVELAGFGRALIAGRGKG